MFSCVSVRSIGHLKWYIVSMYFWLCSVRHGHHDEFVDITE